MPRDFEPVRIRSGSGDGVERVPFFYIDDVEYTIPREVPAKLGMRMLEELAGGEGQEQVIARAIRDVIGADAMHALATSDDVTNEQMDALTGVIEDMVLAAKERAEGKSRAAPRR